MVPRDPDLSGEIEEGEQGDSGAANDDYATGADSAESTKWMIAIGVASTLLVIVVIVIIGMLKA